jgi:hypothetical protein
MIAGPARGMNPLSALSLRETGDDDRVIGTHGEVTRVQMLPTVWRQYRQPGDSRLDPNATYRAAAKCWNDRIKAFSAKFQRPPTPFEMYRLWNSPRDIMLGLPPTKAVAARATLFVNILSSDDHTTSKGAEPASAVRLRSANSVSPRPSRS